MLVISDHELDGIAISPLGIVTFSALPSITAAPSYSLHFLQIHLFDEHNKKFYMTYYWQSLNNKPDHIYKPR